MENQETQTEVVVEEQATTAAAPAVEAAPAPAAEPAKKNNGIGKGVLVLIFFLLSCVHIGTGYQYYAAIVNVIAMIVWFVGYCINGEKSKKVGKIVRTVGVGLMALYHLLPVVSYIGALDNEGSYIWLLMRMLVVVAMFTVLALTDWLHRAKNVMNLVGNILMLVLIILNIVAVVIGSMNIFRFMFIDVVGYTFLAFALKIGKSAIIDFRMD